MAGEIRLEELCKRFDDVVAVDGIDIDMPPGEAFLVRERTATAQPSTDGNVLAMVNSS